jgi:LysR family hydrogen peroxide-inducible transcriptional activator
MERQLGFPIFERDNKKVLVTPLGRDVLDKARRIKLEVEDLERLAEAYRTPLSTPLAIGIIPTIAPYLLPRILPALQAEYPNLELKLSEAQSLRIVEQVRAGELDAGILALPFDVEGLLAFPFWRENFWWVTQADDPLARARKIRADEIDSSRLMLLEDGHCLREHALAVCRLTDVGTKRQSLSATSLPTLVQLVAGRLGSTLVPEMAVPALVDANPALARIALAEPGPHREIAIIVRPTYPGMRSIEVLKSLFARELKRN